MNNLNMMMSMRNPKELTRGEIIRAAKTLRWRRKMPKWTAIVEGRVLPARPLVLEAAGVPPNDSTNSHQAIDILKNLGFETRYGNQRHSRENESLSGSAPNGKQAKITATVLEMASIARQLVPEEEWDRVPTDLAKNIDHYLYGTKKKK